MRKAAAVLFASTIASASTLSATPITTAIYDWHSPGSGVTSSIEISAAAYFAGFADSAVPGQIISFSWRDTPGVGGISFQAEQLTTQLSALIEDRFTFALTPGKSCIQTCASYDNGHYVDPQVTFWGNEVGYAGVRISDMHSRIVN